MSTRDQITEIEAKLAVLNAVYHAEASKNNFMRVIEAQTSIPADEAHLAWELIDYLEWKNEN